MLAPNKEIKESSFAAAEHKKSGIVAVIEVAAAIADPKKSGTVADAAPQDKPVVTEPLVSMADIKKQSGVSESKNSSGVSNIPNPHQSGLAAFK